MNESGSNIVDGVLRTSGYHSVYQTIVIAGDPIDGFYYVGPFASGHDARAWAEEAYGDDVACWLADLVLSGDVDEDGRRADAEYGMGERGTVISSTRFRPAHDEPSNDPNELEP